MTEPQQEITSPLICSNCAYFLLLPEVQGQHPQGQCRANPPVPLGFPRQVKSIERGGMDVQMQIIAVWPVVNVNEWCGTHSALDSGEMGEGIETGNPPSH